MQNSPEFKLGRPHLEEGGRDIELGQPRIVESKEELEEKFKKYGKKLENGLGDFLVYISKGKESLERSMFERLKQTIREDMEGEDKDTTIPLAFVEVVTQALSDMEGRVESIKEEGGIPTEADQSARETARTYLKEFSEIEDFLFSHSELYDALPDRSNLIEWLKNEKSFVESNLNDSALDEDHRKYYESVLKSEVPSIERYLKGLAGDHDYDALVANLTESISIQRRQLQDYLQEYVVTQKDELKPDMEDKLKIIFILRSLQAQLEGERNEKRALKK